MILSSASTGQVMLGVAAAAAYAVPALRAARSHPLAVRCALLVAWFLHALLLVLGLVGDTPRFGFAPALSVTAWLVLTVYGVESRLFPQLQARWALAGLGALAVVLALLFPGQPLHVAASPWLPLHWALGIASYGLFGAAVVHAWLMTRAEQRIRQAADPHSGVPLLTLERLTFRFVSAGFVLLSATLLAGWLFGETLYGRAWKWDHKSVFSVLSWLAFATLLLGRARFGWRGKRALRMLYIGTGLLLLAYVGSRFVLEVLLTRGGTA
ncbi:cytochrome c biogenesis protein CcsA [Curvibacter sp. HBC28]|uniref:Cytochrome c biogenesis protein CcsA n=1 Tax=Curvibacter microcysteis TaxID=3026419 RepID=A0ABT5M8X3_9BURK|nr:cytochrome c biogenesis protein CcsA [Curvibacter sp. HBC28]MDD0813033.1 cytochrome c biogenesis protein CcsA [Curvibacter sp. HBC28]